MNSASPLERSTIFLSGFAPKRLTLLLMAPERWAFAAMVPPYRDRGGGIDRRHAQSKGSYRQDEAPPEFRDEFSTEYRAPVKLGPSVYGLSVTEALRVLPNSSLPKPADNIGAPQ
jgi:hypothetical protein